MLNIISKQQSNRQKRVARVIMQEIAQSISRKDIYNPMLEQIFLTVQRVEVSNDLCYAIVEVSFFEVRDTKNGLLNLNKLSYLYRKLIAKKLNLRIVPKIKFISSF
jgi:ribosome-binding factor A